jgi:hypothetical protein
VASRAELRTSRNMIDDLDHTFLREEIKLS